jgi:hypothetical protein
MPRPIITEHNVTTNEIVEREMNDEEFAQYEKDQEAEAARIEAEAQKAADKAALLAKLGINDDEAKLLLS